MRHRKSFNHLSRKSAHRKAMLANMASSLIIHKRIKTTTAKAKALRTFVEPLITRSKEDSTHSRRMVFKHLGDKYAVSELFREVALKVGDRPGGYTRIIKIDNRTGDNADMCIMELVDYNENLLAEKETVKSKGTRRRRGKKKTGVEDQKPVAETVEKTDEELTGDAEEAVAETGDELSGTVEEKGKEEESATAEKEDVTKDEAPVEKEAAKDKEKTGDAREEKTKETAETSETKDNEKPEDVKEEFNETLTETTEKEEKPESEKIPKNTPEEESEQGKKDKPQESKEK